MTEIFNYAGKNQKFNDKLLTLVLQNLNRFSHEDKYIYIYVHVKNYLFRLCTVSLQSKMICPRKEWKGFLVSLYWFPSEKVIVIDILRVSQATGFANIGTLILRLETRSYFHSQSYFIPIKTSITTLPCLESSAF